MLLITDVHYFEVGARAAGILAPSWEAETPSAEYQIHLDQVEEYRSGQFYRRELPCLLALLEHIPTPPQCVVVDGHVWLDGRPGLGGYLHQATRLPVVGIAKRAFRNGMAVPVLRGQSGSPLQVTAAGVAVDDAVAWVRAMHGPFRIPTLLKRVDRLARDGC